MTAINENGQVYWTFEELDLAGAYVELKTEFKMLIGACDYFNIIIDGYEMFSIERDVLKKEWEKAAARVQYLGSIMRLLSGLMTTKEYFDGGCDRV
jgi:uncharacterized short protein YbdD (DUF466 family)